jgi:tRNA(adenine34) deaminase
MESEHARFMKAALEEAALAKAEGNIGVGSVIVRDGVVLERGHNTVDSTFDITAHAETVALRRLSLRLRRPIPRYQTGPGLLAGHVLYTTVEPCAMCAFACCIADVSTIVIGGRFARMGITTHGSYAIEKLLEMTGRSIEIVSGVLHHECASVYLDSVHPSA